MSSDTQMLSNAPTPNGTNGTNGSSSFFGISIRAWIVIMFDSSVLLTWMANNIMAGLGYTSYTFKLEEPLYTIFIAVNTYYFSNIKQQTSK